jgi:flagellar basal body-associated protein FliL
MSEPDKNKTRGISTLFDKDELKKIIRWYIALIFLLEVIIFCSCFLFQLEPVNLPFPWKYYFLSSFLVPIAVTFLLGIFVTAFNIFVFGSSNPQTTDSENPENSDESPKQHSYVNRLNASLSFIRQAPFLLTLLLLGVGSIIFSQLDTLIVFMGEIGVKAVEYVLIILGVIFAVATVFALIWIFMKYKIEKMKYEYQYKQDVMTNLGLLIMDSNTVINNQGEVIIQNESKKVLPKKIKRDKEHLLISQSTRQ